MVQAGAARTCHLSGTPHIARPPVSLKKMLVEEHAGSVLYQSEYSSCFRTNAKLFPATEFLVEVLQHLPDAGTRLIRRYGK
jgi:hypothetical protein